MPESRINGYLKHMMKAAQFSGLVFLGCQVWLKVSGYYEGLEFTQSFLMPLILFPVLLGSTLVFLVASILVAASLIRKKLPLRSARALAVLICIIVGGFWIPFPSFADGMREAVKEKLERDKLLEFAEHARRLKMQSVDNFGYEASVRKLKEKFPAELSLSSIPPRIQVDDGSVSVYYGSALTEHWGYSIVENDECPRRYLPRNLCLKVYDNIWVWDDIY